MIKYLMLLMLIVSPCFGGYSFRGPLEDSTSNFKVTDGLITGATNTNWDDAYNKRVDTWTFPLQFSSNTASISLVNTGIDHGGLAGLGDDDHTQYLLVDGSRALEGNWSLGGFDLTNGGTITATTFTDSVLSINSGSITNAVNVTASGTVQANAIIIADNGFIGSVSEPEAMQIAASGGMIFSGAVQIDSGFLHLNSPVETANIAMTAGEESGNILFISNVDGDRFEFNQDVRTIKHLTAADNITIGDGSSSVDTIIFAGNDARGLFEIEWEDGMEEGDNDFLAFRAAEQSKWDIYLADMTIIVDGTTGTLTMQDFDVVIEEDLELGGDFSADGTNHSLGAYGDTTLVTIKGVAQAQYGSRLNLWQEDATPRGGYIYFDSRTATRGLYLGTTNTTDTDALFISRGSSKVWMLGFADVANRLDCEDLKVEKDGVGIISNVGYSTDSTVAPNIISIRSKGTQGTPLAVVDGDRIGFWGFRGHDGTSPANATAGAAILVNVDGAVAAESVPMEFCFEVMKLGETSRTEAMCIHSSTHIEMFGGLDVTGGASTFGNGTDELQISATGDLSFKGGGGLLYGNMDQDGGVFTVFLETINQLYELDAATTNISAGPLNDVTFPGNHYLEVKTAGVYKIDWSLICQISGLTGGSEHVEFEVLKNGNATGKGESHVTHKNTVRDFPLASTTLLDLAVDDEISIGATARDSSGKTITIDHLEMTIFMVGGT